MKRLVLGFTLVPMLGYSAAWETATNIATTANTAFDTVAPAVIGVTGFVIVLAWVKKLLKRAG